MKKNEISFEVVVKSPEKKENVRNLTGTEMEVDVPLNSRRATEKVEYLKSIMLGDDFRPLVDRFQK
jgi:hypothetical protein